MARDRLGRFAVRLQGRDVRLQLGDLFVVARDLGARDVAAFGHAARVQAVPGADGADGGGEVGRERGDVVRGQALQDLGREIGVVRRGGGGKERVARRGGDGASEEVGCFCGGGGREDIVVLAERGG